MSIELPRRIAALLQEKVDSGLYASVDEAIDAAVRLLDEHDRRRQRLRAAIAEGEAGEAIPWTPELTERLSREAEEMTRQGLKPHPDVCP
jgi:putative addiction module CopG family antidote